MKQFLIFFSIMVVGFLAYFDASTRMDELDEVAANTPSQVELQQTMKKPQTNNIQNNNINIQPQQNFQNNQPVNKIINPAGNSTNQFDKIQERRKTITSPTQ